MSQFWFALFAQDLFQNCLSTLQTQRDTQHTRPRQPTFIDGLLPFFLILEPLKEVFGFFQQPPRTSWLTHESAVKIRLLRKTQNKHRTRNSSDRPSC